MNYNNQAKSLLGTILEDEVELNYFGHKVKSVLDMALKVDWDNNEIVSGYHDDGTVFLKIATDDCGMGFEIKDASKNERGWFVLTVINSSRFNCQLRAQKSYNGEWILWGYFYCETPDKGSVRYSREAFQHYFDIAYNKLWLEMNQSI